MSGLAHSTIQNRFSRYRRFFRDLFETWQLGHAKGVQTPVHPILTECDPLPSSRRVVVILPDTNIDVVALPKRIWELAAPDRRQVLLMIKPCREENEFYARMNLVTLSALIRDDHVHVEMQLVLGAPIDQAARQYAQPEDIFVCFEEHQVSKCLKKKRLADLLAQKTGLPVYTLKGSALEMTDPISDLLKDTLLLMFCMALLVVFFVFQVWIDKNTSGVWRGSLQLITVFIVAGFTVAIAAKTFRM